MSSFKLLSFLALSLSSSTTLALDLQITDVTCNEELPLTANMAMTCLEQPSSSSSSTATAGRCTFGTLVSLSGAVSFNGVDNTNIVNNNNLAYVSATLYGPQDLEIVEFLQAEIIDLCDYGTFVAIGNNDADEDGAEPECPEDGNYAYTKNFTLPDSQYLNNFWASGWDGYSFVEFQDGANMVIGECTISFATYRTALDSESSSNNSKLAQMVNGKSALAFVLVLIGVLMLMTMYCCWACSGDKNKNKNNDKNKNGGKDDATVLETEFTRMQDREPQPKEEKKGPQWTSV